jgi:poly-gamma-glutamate synthesis protein (capsule biosynthesis protein)
MTQDSNSSTAENDDLRIIFCADAFLRTRNGDDPFALISDRIGGRTACINCETSLEGGKQTEKNVFLSVEENSLDCIPPNVSIVNIVNNHMSDGSDPADLARALQRRGKNVIGPNNPDRVSVEINSRSFEFFSAYFPLPKTRLSYKGALADKLEEMIRQSDAERRIVNLHWGYEHTDIPAPFQRDLAQRLVDAGAGLVIGHHPHVPQGWEVYRDATIFYSLGNFNFWQFDKEPSEDNKWGYMVSYDPQSGNAEPVPYRINDNYQPFTVSGSDKDKLSDTMENLCSDLRSIDNATWLSDQYAKWRAHESEVWQKRCRKSRSFKLMLKYLVWLLLPMQMKYYIHTAIKRLSTLFSGNNPQQQ